MAIDWALKGDKITVQELKRKLQKERIEMVVQRGEQGKTYGVFFIDFQSKTAFKGSDLGKQYSAKGLEERCQVEKEHTEKITQKHTIIEQVQLSYSGQSSLSAPSSTFVSDLGYSHLESLWKTLLKPIPQDGDVPYELTRNMKKKKRKKPAHGSSLLNFAVEKKERQVGLRFIWSPPISWQLNWAPVPTLAIRGQTSLPGLLFYIRSTRHSTGN